MAPNSQAGFTTIEVIVALVIVTALLLPITIVSIYFLGAMFDYSTKANLDAETLFALRTIGNDIRGSSNILTTSSIYDPNKPGGWTTNLESGTLVISTASLRADQSPIIDSSTNTPHLNEIVYYVDGSVLKRRSLPSTATGNITQRTCPEAVASASCPADAVLASHVVALSYTLYGKNDVITIDPNQATSININIVSRKRNTRTPNDVTRSLRITKRGF